MNLAYGHLELGHGQEALAQSERAAEIASSLDDKARGLTLYNLGSVHLHLKNFERSVEYSRQAVAVSRKAGVRLWEGNSLLNLGAAHQQLGDLEACADRLRAGARCAGDNARSHWHRAARCTTWVRSPGSGALRTGGRVSSSVRCPSFARSTSGIRTRSSWIRTRYQNPIEVAALQMLIDIYSRTGQEDLKAAHMAALRQIKARPSRRTFSQVPRLAGAPFRRQG